MRPIDADALLIAYDAAHKGPPGGARKLIEDAPTVDAVQVVRCFACEHCTLLADGAGFHCKEWDMDFYAPHYDVTEYYCADGKRR